MVPILPEAIERYCTDHSDGASALAAELEQYTRTHCDASQMLIGPWEGAFLKLLVGASHARRVLEIGTFTGYSALSMAEVLPADGELITCDINAETTAIAQRFFDRSPHGKKIQIRLGPALETLSKLAAPFDLAFIDADKENYGAYFEACLPLLRARGLIAVDNVLWSGRALNPKTDTDRAIAAFNSKVRHDLRVECAMLPIRDGVSLIRKTTGAGG
jgi:caffeoyl-CoA O-methyltransferase